ncbi:MAG: bifunctional folylpolyglutamate synthase/dihydrofolate synthase [Geobacteraceae bacterium]|nr:bifunctional folylpolyglutamate synthase/dihydrofolate synthase [Geobacteraceae bacterium]
MTYDELLTQIFARGRFGMKPGLERITELLARLGNPHHGLKAVQIAGTNGKGSTGAFLSAIMTEAGFKTAFFSSPHLSHFSERFRINDEEVCEELLHKASERVLAAASDDTTFFEIVTGIAFLLFSEANLDVAIMETGMGGRFDATNVAEAVLSLITPVSMDHTAWLGDRLELIAAEKAGIIKGGVPVIIAPQEPEALEVIRQAAYEKGAQLLICSGAVELDGLELTLRGRYQRGNAAMAITAAQLLERCGLHVSNEQIPSGLAKAWWPGRMELIGDAPRILLDGAHNPGGVASLVESLADFSYSRLILVVGMMADKDWRSVLAPLLPLTQRVIAVKPAIDRALEADELAAYCLEQGPDGQAADSVSAGIDLARQEALTGDLILVTGSLFTVGEARAYLIGGSFMPIRG